MQPFEQNARVTFLGDSITAANNFVPRIIGYYYRNLPELRVRFWNSGISGASASTALKFLEADLLATRPDIVPIMLGVNDSSRGTLSEPDPEKRNIVLKYAFDNYCARMNELIDKLNARGIKVILCTPAPYAEFYHTGNDPLSHGYALIKMYAEKVREIARERNLDLVDYHASLSEQYCIEPLYNPDHVHPNDAGHARMADCFLAAQGLPIRKYFPGEAPEPIIPELDEWRTLVEKQRRIFAVESMIVRNYDLPLGEKLKFIEDYLTEKRYNDFMYFKTISESYLENKPQESEIAARINEIMENLYK